MERYYALHIDGDLMYLGEYKNIEECIEDNWDDFVWYMDEEVLYEWKAQIELLLKLK
jgi:hypothetical protein